MQFLETIANIANNLSGPAKLAVTAILTAVAVFFGAKPAAKTMSAFADKKWLEAGTWALAVILIFGVPVLFVVFATFGNVFGGQVGQVFE